MAMRIVIEKGPDQGKALQLDPRAELRVGRGPGNHLMVQDPAWQGTLRVAFSQGVCKVTNQTATTIYLGGKTFAPGEQRAWFHGESLQPTAQTLLVLYVDDDAKASTEAKQGSAARKTMQLTIILLCVPVAALLLFMPAPQETVAPQTPEQRSQEYQRLVSRLQELNGRADGGDMAGRILARLREARFEQQRAHPAQAFKLYQRAREEVEADLGPPARPRELPDEIAQTFRDVRVFINQQLIALGAEGSKQAE
jgi:hypothetical protein